MVVESSDVHHRRSPAIIFISLGVVVWIDQKNREFAYLLLISYGSVVRASTAYPTSVTPPNLGPIHRVFLCAFQGGPGLFYTRTECEDAIRRQHDVRNGYVHYDDNAVD